MLGTILNQLQALLPKRIVIGIFIPLLMFFVGNATLLYSQRLDFRGFVDQTLLDSSQGAEPAHNGTIAFLSLFLLSYVVSMFNTLWREILEGRRWWPARLRVAYVRRQWERFESLQRRVDEMQEQRFTIEAARWPETLAAVREAMPKQPTIAYSASDKVAGQLVRLRAARAEGALIDIGDLATAAKGLGEALARSELSYVPKGLEAQAELLDRHQGEFIDLVEYAHQRLVREITDRFNERDFGYPSHDLLLAPTALGNVARSIESYAESRYGINFAVVWTRLAKTMQNDEFYATVQDAKTQVDFLVSCIWFGAASLVGWLGYFALFGYSLTPFLLMAAFGPPILLLLYGLCVENYRAFAALVRSAIDIYRLKLLGELHIPLPEGALEERRLWEAMNRQLGFGEAFAYPYDHGR
jgi:hypothetical protein